MRAGTAGGACGCHSGVPDCVDRILMVLLYLVERLYLMVEAFASLGSLPWCGWRCSRI